MVLLHQIDLSSYVIDLGYVCIFIQIHANVISKQPYVH